MLLAISAIGDDIDKEIINDAFEHLWPDLEESFNSIQTDTSKIDVPAREPRDMLQELLELVRAQSQIILEGKVSSDQKERAEIIIKILKEGIYDELPFSHASIIGSCASITDTLRDWHNTETKEKLEKELLDMALGKK